MSITGTVGASVPLVLLGLLVSVASPAPVVHSPAPEPFAVAPGSGSCAGQLSSERYGGGVVDVGGPSGLNVVAGVGIEYRYFVEAVAPSSHGSSECIPIEGSTTTAANGEFRFVPSIPPPRCENGTNGSCIDFLGSFGPVSVSLAEPPPPGFLVSIAQNGTRFSISLVYELARVTTSPSGNSMTVAPGAPAAFEAHAWTGNGAPTPLDPTYEWNLSGTGWSFLAMTTGTNATVVAAPGAPAGTLTVRATTVINGTTIVSPPDSVSLVAVSTTIETGELSATSGDVGSRFALNLIAIGAAGYPYLTTIDPGLGMPSQNVTCGSNPSPSNTVTILCATNLTYSVPGTAQPTASVTNGYSASTWRFPNVTVTPLPALTIAPASPTGYVLSPIPVTLAVANGTGAVPFSEGCVEVFALLPNCDATPGPEWTFALSLATVGTFPATAWAIDGDGVNRSVAFSVEVVAPLALGPIDLSTSDLTAEAPVGLSANLSGGELPLSFWWNASGVSGSLLAGTLDVDGPVSLTFVPSLPGAVAVSLTVVDARGTVTEVDRVLSVGPALAVAVTVVVAPPAVPTVAGTPLTIEWEGLDRAGNPVRSFAEAGVIVLSGGARAPPPAWVNASGLGALPSLGNGTYGLPSSAWVGGALSISITIEVAGTYSVGLEGVTVPSGGPPLSFSVGPDLNHLTFYDPLVVRAGARENATYWHVTDRYGNPAAGAVVAVRTAFGPFVRDALGVVVVDPAGGTGAWVNYSAPGDEAGTVSVLDGSGRIVVGPIDVPAVGPGPILSETTVTFAAAIPVGVTGALLANVVARRARRSAPETETGEEDLRALAEGRDWVVATVRRLGAADLGTLEAAWEPPPAPVALADWLASLVADGTLGATLGPDGRARFCLATGSSPVPRVTVDAEALDRALQGRDAEFDEGPDA